MACCIERVHFWLYLEEGELIWWFFVTRERENKLVVGVFGGDGVELADDGGFFFDSSLDLGD